jgi:quercetin dioxygenase-like cupin family protein
MDVVVEGDRSHVYGGRFTGAVELEMLHEAAVGDDAADRPDIAKVHFHDGAVTFWHVHPGGQHLLVLEGEARVGTEADGEVRLERGTLVVCPAGERHWHGAAAGSSTTLLAVTWGTTQWEDVAPE